MDVTALDGDKFLVSTPDGEQEVEGFQQARTLAHELAAKAGEE